MTKCINKKANIHCTSIDNRGQVDIIVRTHQRMNQSQRPESKESLPIIASIFLT